MLHEFELVDHDNRIEVMRKLQAKAKEIMLPSRFFSFIWRVVIETAIVEPVDYSHVHQTLISTNVSLIQINGTDIERPTPHAINLRNNMANAWLTQAFNDPESLDCDPDFNDYRIAGNSTQSRNSRITAPMKALVIRTGVNKSVMALLLLFSAAIACVIGILVGILTSRADLGFGVACAVFALIAVLRELVVGYMKELGGGGRG